MRILFVLLLIALPPAIATAKTPAFYGELDRAARLDEADRAAAEVVRATWPAAEIRIDRALSRAAASIAAGIAAGGALGEAAGAESIRLALARAGAVVPEVFPLLVRASTRELALQRVRERLAREASQPPPRQAGVAIEGSGGSIAVVILLAPERVALQPFPVSVQLDSTHRLAGHLLAPLAKASIHVTRPDGKTVRLAAGQAAKFSVPIQFMERGRHTLEVLGDGPRGPEVAALLDVWAGAPIPRAAAVAVRPVEPDTIEGMEALAAKLVNGLRAERKLAPLRIDPKLTQAARRHAEEILRTGHFAHRSPISGTLDDRLRAAGYAYLRAGENLAQAPGVVQAHESTVRSPGHLANLVEPAWREAGFGIARGTTAGGTPTVVLVELFAVPAPIAARGAQERERRVHRATRRSRKPSTFFFYAKRRCVA